MIPTRSEPRNHGPWQFTVPATAPASAIAASSATATRALRSASGPGSPAHRPRDVVEQGRGAGRVGRLDGGLPRREVHRDLAHAQRGEVRRRRVDVEVARDGVPDPEHASLPQRSRRGRRADGAQQPVDRGRDRRARR